MHKFEAPHIFGPPEAQVCVDELMVEIANFVPHETAIETCVPHHTLVSWIFPQPIMGQCGIGGSSRLSALGNLTFVPATVPVHSRFRPEVGPRRAVVARFAHDMFERLGEDMPHRCDPWSMVSHNFRNPDIQLGMRQLAKEALTPGFASAILVESMGTSLMVQLTRHFGQRSSTDGRGRLAPWQLRRIIECIAAGSATDSLPTLAQLAALVGISTGYLRHAFKQSTGSTIGTHIRNVQLDRARFLLSRTDLALKEIAMRLGFSTQYGFTLAFQRGTGETPSVFRQQQRASMT